MVVLFLFLFLPMLGSLIFTHDSVINPPEHRLFFSVIWIWGQVTQKKTTS